MFKSRQLAAAVLLSCSTLLAPFHAQAAHTTKYDLSDDGGKLSLYVDDMETPFINFMVYSATSTGDSATYRDFFTLGNGINMLNEQQAIANGISYVKDLLGQPVETPTIRLFLEAAVNNNAAAASDTMANGNTGIGNYFIYKSSLPDEYKFNYGIDTNGEETINADTCVWIWPRNTGWDASDVGNLSRNIDTQSMSSVIVHELFHALGMAVNHYIFITDDGKIGYKIGVDTDANYANKYTMHIYDVYGRQAKVGDEIVYINTAEKERITPEAGKFYMYLSDGYDSKGNAKHTYDSGCYFSGTNVDNVLTIGSDHAQLYFPVDSNIKVPGLPLNGDEGYPELSHIELQNSFLSHQYFRNWSVPMEAELAMMQDLGYDIDRRNFFGFSVYNDGLTITNDKGYFARNEAGTAYLDGQANKQDWGVGLHVYGQKNNVTQTGKIMADGDYAIGIRLDGTQDNVLNLQTDVTANGKGGNGIAVTWGRNHTVNIDNGSSVKALGDGGVALRFDFGHNDIGDDVPSTEIVGSYIYYKNYRHTAYDMIIPASKLLTALNGPLVKECNINGTIEGSEASIYISKNAYVKEINIGTGTTIKGDIISEWNPKGMLFSESNPVFLENRLPANEDGLTNININQTMSFSDNIIGSESLVLNVATGKNFSSGQDSISPYALRTVSTASTDSSPIVDVYRINVNTGATYNNSANLSVRDTTAPSSSTDGAITIDGGHFNNSGNLIVSNGQGTISVTNNGHFIQSEHGTLTSTIDGSGNSTKIALANNGTASLNGTLNIVPQKDFYGSQQTINLLADGSTGSYSMNNNLNINILPTEGMTITHTVDGNGNIIINRERHFDTYGQSAAQKALGQILNDNLDYLGNLPEHGADWQKLFTELDAADGAGKASALKQMNPSIMHSSTQATLNTHSMLNNLNMLGSFSNNIPATVTGGGSGPAVDEAPKYNAWRNIVMPFSAYTNQHRGSRGYTNHNSGVIGAMERTFANGLTHGYHAAVNHQSTSEAGSRIKGEGLYLGTQATYAPADWNGWSVFGSARLGLEQMRSHRNINIGGYTGTADADWIGYSGSLSLGTALTKEYGVMQSGPFAALDYSFAHRPSVHEDGDAIRTNLESATYDSLRTQLGYRLTTKPKALDSYDSTNWQAHASVAWNHELLSDNGSTSYQLTDLPGVTITDKAETYGRDSMSIAAGVIFKTPNRLDVGLTLGSDIYRKGGSSIYGKATFEWKF